MVKGINPAAQMTQLKKQHILEQLWLSYYNDSLYEKGLITNNERNRMRVRIQNRIVMNGR